LKILAEDVPELRSSLEKSNIARLLRHKRKPNPLIKTSFFFFHWETRKLGSEERKQVQKEAKEKEEILINLIYLI
jgi:hypothetical protein